MVTPSVLSRTTTLSRVPTLNAEHVRVRGNVVEPLSSRGWMVWRALRPPGPDEYPESDASTITNSQASIESNIREGIDGKLGTKSPFLTSSFSVLHITLSVLGGALSSGFLIAGGFTIFCAGPGGALVAFALTMLALYAVMTSLMELRCVIPDNVPYYLFSAHVLGQTVGAASAWNYWLMWISIITYEVAAFGHILHFWVPHVHPAVWCLPMFLCCFAIVIINTKYYTVAEHSFTMLKLCGILVALICGSLIAAGKLGDHKYGLENWHQGDAPFVGGALGVACAAVYSGFSIVGAEAAATMALRTCTPRGRRLVPAFVCGGLAIFFMTSIFITGLVVSYNSSWFQSDDNAGESAASSTFTFIFEQARLRAGADVVNAVLLVTALFDCCAALYVSSALLQDLAMRSLAPRFLRKPLGQREGQEFSVYCLIVGSVVALTLWGLSNIGTKYSLSIIAGAIGVSGYIMWGLVAIMHSTVQYFGYCRC
ncbi:hypothetical protein GGH92_003680 [Coemansia sp. RSA 2673]|nr:hypothetical protein GGH92_003680 [Coemansia sp. RSA 2673]